MMQDIDRKEENKAPETVASDEEKISGDGGLTLEEENELLRREIERMKEKNLKEKLYDHVHVSVRTMDIFIGFMLFLLAAVIILGLLDR